nr:hypothetical protein [Gemmatimonadota bacterium]
MRPLLDRRLPHPAAAPQPELPLHTIRSLAEARELPPFRERVRSLAGAEDVARELCARVQAEGDAALREL